MGDSQISDIREKIWQFIRGDLPTVEFEKWVYAASELEILLNRDFYLKLISADYRDKLEINNVRDTLRDWAERFPRNCDCITWRNEEGIPLGSDTLDLLKNFEILKKHSPWLDLLRCSYCKTHWYVGVDTNDDWYYLRRLTHEEVERILYADDWPNCFDKIQHLWPTEGWLKIFGYKSLEDWRSKHSDVTER